MDEELKPIEESAPESGEPKVEVVSEKKSFFRLPSIRSEFNQFLLPGAILLAALLVSGALVLTHGKRIGDQGALIGAGNNQGGKVEFKVGPDDHILGNKDAKVTFVEFADYRCPFCERFYQQSELQLKKEYIDTGKVKFIFKNFAFLGQQSVWAAEAAECAAEQGKFWQMHDWLYNNQASESDLAYYSKANLIKYAANVGVNVSQFASCLNTDKYAKRVADDLAYGQQLGINATPTAIINGQIVVGAQPYSSFKSAIDALLK